MTSIAYMSKVSLNYLLVTRQTKAAAAAALEEEEGGKNKQTGAKH